MRRWADVLIVAPASANVIAKSSYGIADNFVLSVMRAWDFRKPCILCPAMNTVMWTHPTTHESLSRLQSWGWEVLGPVEKVLACNDKGNGAMVSVQDIKTFLVAKFAPQPPGSPVPLTDSNLQLHSALLSTAKSLDAHHPSSSSNKLKAKLTASKTTAAGKETIVEPPSTEKTDLKIGTAAAEEGKASNKGVVAKSSMFSGSYHLLMIGLGIGAGYVGMQLVLGVALAFLFGVGKTERPHRGNSPSFNV